MAVALILATFYYLGWWGFAALAVLTGVVHVVYRIKTGHWMEGVD